MIIMSVARIAAKMREMQIYSSRTNNIECHFLISLHRRPITQHILFRLALAAQQNTSYHLYDAPRPSKPSVRDSCVSFVFKRIARTS